MTSAGFQNAVRVQQSFLAPLERICLSWLARRVPLSVGPDHLTLVGFLAMLLAGIFYALAGSWTPALLLVNLCLALNWFGDSLDGTLARVRNRQRPRYGFYVDHIVDAFGALFLLTGLALSGYMSERVAMVLLIAYFLLSINVYLATYTRGAFHLSFWKFSPTELRVLLAVGNLVALARPMVFEGRYRFFDVGGVVALGLITIVLVVSVIGNISALYRAEKV